MRKNIKKIFNLLILFFTFFLSGIVSAEQTTELTLDKAIKMAIEVSEDLQIRNNDVDVKTALYKEAKSAIYPNINHETTWTNNYDYPQTSALNDYELSSGVTATQLLWAFGKVSSAIEASQKYLKVGTYQKEKSLRDVQYEVKTAYYSALLAGEVYEIVNKSYQNARANKTILEDRSSQGRVSKKDNIKMDSDIAARMPTMNNAKINKNTAIQTLKRIVGIPSVNELVLVDSFSETYQEISFNKFENILLTQEPSLKASEETVAYTKDLVTVIKATFYPEVSTFLSWTYKGESGRGDNGTEEVDPYGVVGVKMSLPVWNGGAKHHQLKQARLVHENAILELEKKKKDLLLALDISVTEYNKSITTLMANEESVRLAEESFKFSQDLFSSGQISLADLNDAELILTNERLSRQQTLFSLNMALANIEKLTSQWELVGK